MTNDIIQAEARRTNGVHVKVTVDVILDPEELKNAPAYKEGMTAEQLILDEIQSNLESVDYVRHVKTSKR